MVTNPRLITNASTVNNPGLVINASLATNLNLLNNPSEDTVPVRASDPSLFTNDSVGDDSSLVKNASVFSAPGSDNIDDESSYIIMKPKHKNTTNTPLPTNNELPEATSFPNNNELPEATSFPANNELPAATSLPTNINTDITSEPRVINNGRTYAFYEQAQKFYNDVFKHFTYQNEQ
jgi:hypothetical protein